MIDYLKKEASITGSYYSEQKKKLREAIKDKRRGKFRAKVLFHRDNAPSHKAQVMLDAIREAGFELVNPSLFSRPSPQRLLFPRLKKHLRGQKFADDSEVMAAVQAFFEEQDNFFNEIQL
ncbi:unnamed protein product [Euphydryas editha]|uniref:Transposase n=1 Tax=Euphydryas editha TaxID=104508 RepID=A0AAU9V9J7_EUPED|nr:unnamed protein product [Euphydryas editha]